MTGYQRDFVLEKNVKMFVPDTLAVMHDSIIQQYVQTGVSRLVGSGRDTLVKTKSGTYSHCYVYLSEITRDKDLYFVIQADPYASYDGRTPSLPVPTT